MKFIYLILFSSFFFSCSDCKKVEKGTSHSIVVDGLYHNGGLMEFEAFGYTKLKVLEYDSTMNFNQLKGSYPNEKKTFFPLAHKFAQTTFIFIVDTAKADTLIIGDYNASLVYTDKCNYAFEIDEPKIKYSTFKSWELKEFDTEYQNLEIKLSK